MNRIDVGPLTAAYEDRGTGPVLLLVHGFPLSSAMWRWQLEELSADYRVIAPDLRGLGQTPLPTEDEERESLSTPMRQFADDLAGLLAALKITESIVLCGMSMGGYVAFEFVRRHRGLLRGLILCNTRAEADTSQAAAARLDTAERVLEHGSELLAEAMAMKLLSEGTARRRPEVVAAVREMIVAAPAQGVAAAQRGMALRADASEILPTIDLPTLVLGAAEDALSPPDEMRTMAAALPQAEYVEIADAGHLAVMEQPAAVNEALGAFLKRLQG